MINSNRSKQGGGSSGRSSILSAKILRCSPGNGGSSIAASVVDVEEGLSASPSTLLHSLHQESGSTNEINFMCNFSKNMICSFQFSGNQSNSACDAMLKLSFQVEPIMTYIKNYWNTRLKRQKRAGLTISPPEVRQPPHSFASLLASVQLPSSPKNTGLTRSGKSCRSRRANLKEEAFSVDVERRFYCRWLFETDHFPYPVQPKTLWLQGSLNQPLEATATGTHEK